MNTFAASGSPMSPRSITARAVCSPAPRNVSGAHPSAHAALASRARTSAAPSASSTPSGFSLNVALPASSAARLTAACASGGVRFTTASMSGSASTVVEASAPGAPNFAASSSARPASSSTHAASSTKPSCEIVCAYVRLITPHPTIATRLSGAHDAPRVAVAHEVVVAALDRVEHVGRAAVELDDVPARGRARGRARRACRPHRRRPRPSGSAARRPARPSRAAARRALRARSRAAAGSEPPTCAQ